MSDDLVYRLRRRAEIRRQIPDRKSVQEGQPDRIADLLEEAADALEKHEWDEQPVLGGLYKEVVKVIIDEAVNQKREWVGLTDEEIEAIYDQENHADVVLLTQAKLKEKNT